MPVVPFRAPTRRRLHEDVADQLRDAILDGRFPAGAKLPPERELATEFAVNRTSVREAIKVLEGLGLVTVRQGDGATVQALVDASLALLGPMIFHGNRVDTALMAEMNEVVMPMLLEMGRLAIERRRPEHLQEIKALRDVAADEKQSPGERMRAFHDLLVLLSDMSRNRVWQMLARRMYALLRSEPLQAARERLGRNPGRLVPALDRAVAALDANRDHEAVKALHDLIRTIGDPSTLIDATQKGRARTRSTR